MIFFLQYMVWLREQTERNTASFDQNKPRKAYKYVRCASSKISPGCLMSDIQGMFQMHLDSYSYLGFRPKYPYSKMLW